MTREKWEAMTAEERKAWRERRDKITAVLVAIATTIVFRLMLHSLGL